MVADQFFVKTENGYIRFKRICHNGQAYGGLFSSGFGVVKFLQDMLLKKPILMSEKTLKLFFTQQHENSGNFISMTLGWLTGKVNNLTYFVKPSGGSGCHSNVRINLKKISQHYF